MGSGNTKPNSNNKSKSDSTTRIKHLSEKKFFKLFKSSFKNYVEYGLDPEPSVSAQNDENPVDTYSKRLFLSAKSSNDGLIYSVFGIKGCYLCHVVGLPKLQEDITNFYFHCKSSVLNSMRELEKIRCYMNVLSTLIHTRRFKISRRVNTFYVKFFFPVVNEKEDTFFVLRIPFEKEYKLNIITESAESVKEMYSIMEHLLEMNNKVEKVQDIGQSSSTAMSGMEQIGMQGLKSYVNGSFDIPANIVIKILNDWKKTSSFCREKDKIEFIINSISNDTLYEIDLKSLLDREEHEETREWVLDSFIESNSVQKQSSMGLLRAVAKAVIFTNKLVEKAKMKKEEIDLELHVQKTVLRHISEKGSCLDYDMFQFFPTKNRENDHPILFTTLYLFKFYNLFVRFNIDLDKLTLFIKTIEGNYGQNPFHNKYHAADVVMTCHYLVQKSQLIRDKLTSLDIMSLLIAAVVHDYQHTGHTNVFEVSTEGPLSGVYNDQSVLENYHLSSGLGLLKKKEMNFLINLSQKQKKIFRSTVITLVLNTDTGKHFTLLSKFKATILKSFNSKKREDLLNYLSLLLKCSDVSNPCKPSSIYFEWVRRIMEEFYIQGDQEQQMKMTISPFMSRKTSSSRCQVSFITYLCIPLFETLVTFDQCYLEMLENLVLHLSFFEKVCEEEEMEMGNHKKIDFKLLERMDIFEIAKKEMEQRITKFTKHLITGAKNGYKGIVSDKKEQSNLNRSISSPNISGGSPKKGRNRNESVL